MLRLVPASFLALLIGTAGSDAHEFWIAPEAFRAAVGDSVVASLRVGETFPGMTQSYAPDEFERFEILTTDGAIPVEGEAGDLPALNAADLPEGLVVIVHQSTARDRTWDAWGEFAAYAEREGLGDVAALHDERGLDRTRVREEYTRHAKSLIAIGHGHGTDSVVGLRAEFVALANPYTDDLAGALPVQMWLDGEPCPAARMEVFARPVDGGEAELTVYETDTNGIAVITVAPGMEYLVSSVRLEPVDVEPGTEGAVWRTLWASLTFEVPRPDAAQ